MPVRDRSLFMPTGGLEEIKGGGSEFFWSDEGGGLREKTFCLRGGFEN